MEIGIAKKQIMLCGHKQYSRVKKDTNDICFKCYKILEEDYEICRAKVKQKETDLSVFVWMLPNLLD